MANMLVSIGIDVACAKNKRLPICFAAWRGGRLEPLEIPDKLAAKFPLGRGNREILEAEPFKVAAIEAGDAILEIVEETGWTILRIAVDASAAARASGLRASESALSKSGLSNFQTPTIAQWSNIHNVCREHLSAGKSLSRLPHANKVWMLYGFELFKVLRERGFEVIEVFPNSIVRALLPKCLHKSTKEGYTEQLQAIAGETGWSSAPSLLETKLKERVPGAAHDRLDAFMSTWVAGLDPEERCAYGDEANLDDAIWVPRTALSCKAIGR